MAQLPDTQPPQQPTAAPSPRSSSIRVIDTRTTHANRGWRPDIDRCDQENLVAERRAAALAAEVAGHTSLVALSKAHRERMLLMMVVEAARYQRRFFQPSGTPTDRLFSAWNAALRPLAPISEDPERPRDAPYLLDTAGGDLPLAREFSSDLPTPTCRSFMLLTNDAVAMLLSDVRMLLSAQSVIRSSRDDFMFDSVTQQLYNLRLFTSSAFYAFYLYRPPAAAP